MESVINNHRLFFIGGIAMPYKPKTPCKHPGCANLVDSKQRFCDVHKPLHPEAIRSATKRGYNYKWNVRRKQYLAKHPLCVECQRQGKLTPATVVVHIVPHRGRQDLMWDENNWQSLCKPCHDKKTGREDSMPVYSY